MNVQPYLFFEGRCEEALEFYKAALGAKVQMLMRYGEAPPQGPEASDACGDGPAPPADKVMHATFSVGGSAINCSDGMCQGPAKFQGVSLSLTVPTVADAERTYKALSDGGQVQMPLAATFFSPSFGMLADKFGVSWMVYVAPKPGVASN